MGRHKKRNAFFWILHNANDFYFNFEWFWTRAVHFTAAKSVGPRLDHCSTITLHCAWNKILIFHISQIFKIISQEGRGTLLMLLQNNSNLLHCQSEDWGKPSATKSDEFGSYCKREGPKVAIFSLYIMTLYWPWQNTNKWKVQHFVTVTAKINPIWSLMAALIL